LTIVNTHDQAREAKFVGKLAQVQQAIQAVVALGDRFVDGKPMTMFKKVDPAPKHKYVNIKDF
jgi:hypothetical protein